MGRRIVKFIEERLEDNVADCIHESGIPVEHRMHKLEA